MKKGWEYKKLGEVGTFSRGINFAKSDFVKDGFPCIHYGQIHTTFGPVTYKHLSCIPQEIVKKDKLASKGNLVIAITSEDVEGSCKCTAWMGDYDIAVGAHAAIFKHQLNPIFVSYFFSSPLFQKAKEPYVHGFKVMEIKPSDIAKISIPVPPLSEQQSIVNYLDSAFAKIDALKANAEKALGEAKALFQASLKEMLEPKEGWEEKKLGDIADFVRGPFGGSLTKSMFKSSGYAVYEQQHAIHQHINIRYFIDDAKFKEMERFSVKAGDVIMSCSGVTLGKINILPQDSPAGIINQALLKMTVKASTNVRFFKYWLESNYFQAIIKKYSGGAAIPNVPAVKILKDFVISIPSPPEQHSIVATLDSLKSKVDRLQENYEKISKECDALKQAMLREIFE